VISIRQLDFAYGSRQVLHGVDFGVGSGELVSVLGMNGSGKSTLLKCITGLLRPSQGEVEINGRSTGSLSRQELAQNIGYLPQNSQPVDCTVFEAVLIGRKPHLGWQVNDNDLAETSRILSLTGLSDYADRSTLHLSGGELQRVAIARTLAQQPSVLLLDEPVNHLDIRSQIDVMDLIRSLTLQLGIATIAVMHDLNMALRFSDRFVLMQEGQVRAAGGQEVMTAENIREVYQLHVVRHELDGIPLVIPCPEREPTRNVFGLPRI
jgi:iron complex transport system ATP-binding protein